MSSLHGIIKRLLKSFPFRGHAIPVPIMYLCTRYIADYKIPSAGPWQSAESFGCA